MNSIFHLHRGAPAPVRRPEESAVGTAALGEGTARGRGPRSADAAARLGSETGFCLPSSCGFPVPVRRVFPLGCGGSAGAGQHRPRAAPAPGSSSSARGARALQRGRALSPPPLLLLPSDVPRGARVSWESRARTFGSHKFCGYVFEPGEIADLSCVSSLAEPCRPLWEPKSFRPGRLVLARTGVLPARAPARCLAPGLRVSVLQNPPFGRKKP